MLDRDGNRINRRNPQDIFTPLYDKQIPPGAAAVMHYRIDVPAALTAPVELTAKVRYRKFDYEYMKLVHAGRKPHENPDRGRVRGQGDAAGGGRGRRRCRRRRRRSSPHGSGWNDYGHRLLPRRRWQARPVRQARRRSRSSSRSARRTRCRTAPDLARVYIDEGRLDEAAKAVDAAGKCDPPRRRGRGRGSPRS